MTIGLVATKARLASTPPHMDESDYNVDLTKVFDQRRIILSILCDFLEEDRIADLGDWLDHVGFDLTALRYPADLSAAWAAHYRLGRGYDVDRALNDHLTWPPIAARIALLSEQSRPTGSAACELEKRRSQKLSIDLGNLADDL